MYGLCWFLLCCGGLEMNVPLVCFQTGIGGVGNNSIFLVWGCGGA